MELKEVENFAKKQGIKFPLFMKRKHFAAVSQEVRGNEELLFFCSAKKEGKDGTLILTSSRVAWVDNGMFNNSVVSTAIEKIISVTREEKGLNVRMEFFDANGSFAVDPYPLYGRKIEEILSKAQG